MSSRDVYNNGNLPIRPKAKPVRLRGASLREINRHSSQSSKDSEAGTPTSPQQYFPTMAQQRRMVIALDYGTTFTGVAFWVSPNDPMEQHDIQIITDWGDPGTHHKIPSVISYSKTEKDELQWGISLSPDAVAMVNTKLELDVQDRKIDELELILQVLDGMNNLDFDDSIASEGFPDYTWKGPEQVATDYLTKVFECVERTIAYFSDKVLPKLAVDIVITVPVKWSYRAKNSTLRAVRNAGFNEKSFPGLRDTIMTTEPEAAAMYTARYLKEKEGENFLREGECFLLCDAGGGTVDVVTYRVKKLEPNLELQSLTLPTGDKFGSIYIDQEFKKWLHRLLGRHYRLLDPANASKKISAHATEGGHMRLLMKEFDRLKRQFSSTSKGYKLDLPEPLNNLTTEGVSEGEFEITNDDMRSFFDPCVNGIIELIEAQILQVERKGKRVKTIFLVGGFGESQYLQEELSFSMRLRKIQLRRPDTSWTAVVRGGCLYGIEKEDHKDLTVMKTCSRNYGVMLHAGFSGAHHKRKDRYDDVTTGRAMANGQLTWLISKGDLLLSDEPKESQREFGFNFREQDDRKISLPVYEYLDDDVPDSYHTAKDELKQVALLQCNFSNIDLAEFDRFENTKTGRPYYSAMCVCKATLSDKDVQFEIIWNDVQLCCESIKDVQRTASSSGNPKARGRRSEEY